MQSTTGPVTRGFAFAAPTCAALLAYGWWTRDESFLSPSDGLGYALGIVGTSCMAILLLYSLRKRSRALAAAGPVRHWFAAHMMLGLFGPVAIAYHANFELGSTNSTVALVCVLTVASSGVIGRFVYPKLHVGLYGRRLELSELVRRAHDESGDVLRGIGGADAELSRLVGLASPSPSLWESLRRIAGNSVRIRSAARRLQGIVARERDAGRISADAAREADEHIRATVRAVGRAAEFAAYERVFSLWHAAHLPLCVMLFGAAAVHVLAVHMY